MKRLEAFRRQASQRMLGVAGRGDQDELVEQLDFGVADINYADKTGMSAMHHAAKGGHLESLEALVKKGASPDETCDVGRTPIHLAAKAGHIASVRFLLTCGVRLEEQQASELAPVTVASDKKEEKIVELMARHLNLLKAVEAGNIGALEALLQTGGNIETRREDGTTLLGISVVKRDNKMVECLCRHGANLYAANKNGLRSFELAKIGGSLSLPGILEQIAMARHQKFVGTSFLVSKKRREPAGGKAPPPPKGRRNCVTERPPGMKVGK